jgi:hypothetical protein
MQYPNDSRRCLTVLDQDSTLIAVIEMSLSSWLVAGIVPGIERQPLKKLEADKHALLKLLHRWRDEAVKSRRKITRIAVAFEAGRDGFWLARWLRAHGIEAHVIHASSVAVPREHRRAKTDRLDTEMLKRAFLGWLRGERDHCKVVAIPSLAEEDAKRPNRERESLVGEYQTSRHNVDRLLKIGQTNLGIFSKAALGARKQRADPSAAAWLGAYLKDAYAPMPKDFRHLRSLVCKHRATYEAKYRDLRHKLFAHKEVSYPADVSALFAKTNVRELQRVLLFLLALYDALWMLFVNGHKPVLRMRRYSVARIRKNPSGGKGGSLQERLIREIEQFLTTAAAQLVARARS